MSEDHAKDSASLPNPSRGAAFFDLDKTLIEGSSGVHFARAAYRSGMIGRRFESLMAETSCSAICGPT